MQIKNSGTKSPHGFGTTHWSLIVSAGETASPQTSAALNELCASYWYPVYAFIRKEGNDPHTAEDLTQSFFARLIGNRMLSRANPDRGRFRCYLMTSVRNFVRSEHAKSVARKRGGGATVLSLDREDAESLYARCGADLDDPVKLFDASWSRTVIDRVLSTLQAHSDANGKSDLFEHLQRHLWDDSDALPYAALAKDLGMTETAIKVRAYRLRGQFRDLLREEIAKTLENPDDIDEEMAVLMAAFER